MAMERYSTRKLKSGRERWKGVEGWPVLVEMEQKGKSVRNES
jgi:hypothetical protein